MAIAWTVAPRKYARHSGVDPFSCLQAVRLMSSGQVSELSEALGRGAPSFRFAVVGVEAFDGVVLDELAVQQCLDASTELEHFAPGFAWLPYRREHYEGSDRARGQ